MPNICRNQQIYDFWGDGWNCLFLTMDYINTPESSGMKYVFTITLHVGPHEASESNPSFYNYPIYINLRFNNGQSIISGAEFKPNVSGGQWADPAWTYTHEYTSIYTGSTAPKLDVNFYNSYGLNYGWNSFPEGSGTLDFLTPPSITNLTLTPDGYNSITFNWTANKKASKIRYKLYNGSSWSNWNELNVSPENSSGSYRLTNLEFYHEYKLILQAYNAAGWSSDSSTVTDKTWGAFMYHKDGNIWRKCLVWYKDGNTWKKTIPYFKEGSTWKKSIIK